MLDKEVPILGKLTRSIRTRGLGGTAAAIGEMAVALVRPHHVLHHLLVPFEMLAHPRHAASWFADRFSSRAAPAEQGLPWIAWPCVDYLARYLQPSHHVFEWGGGGSTLFFLKKGCRVTTVESDPEWVRQLQDRVRAQSPDARSRWDLRFVPVKGNGDPSIGEYVRQVSTGAPWDVVMVDGWSRMNCLLAGRDDVKAGGVLVIDNANQKQFADVPQLMEGWQRYPFRGLGVARSWVTQTDVYVRPLLAEQRSASREQRPQHGFENAVLDDRGHRA